MNDRTRTRRDHEKYLTLIDAIAFLHQCQRPVKKDANRFDYIEVTLDDLNDSLPPLTEFVLPGGGPAGALLHQARTVCRRAERSVVTLSHEAEVPELFLVYLNRLSDLLFTLARLANHREGAGDVTW